MAQLVKVTRSSDSKVLLFPAAAILVTDGPFTSGAPAGANAAVGYLGNTTYVNESATAILADANT